MAASAMRAAARLHRSAAVTHGHHMRAALFSTARVYGAAADDQAQKRQAMDVITEVFGEEKGKGKGGNRKGSRRGDDEGDDETPVYRRRLGRPVVIREAKDINVMPPELVWRATDATKQALYAKYVEDPEHWTIMKLADEFQLNPHRVKAIIKHMQIREEEFARAEREANDDSIPEEKKFKLFWSEDSEVDQVAYDYINVITGMYGMPTDEGSSGGRRGEATFGNDFDEDDPYARPEPLVVDPTAESSPAFRVVGDDEIESFYKRVAEDALHDMPEAHMERIPDTPAKTIRKDPELKLRAKVVFTDTSKGASGSENRDIRVRERDGVLRTATGEERYKIEKTRYPSKRNTRLY